MSIDWSMRKDGKVVESHWFSACFASLWRRPEMIDGTHRLYYIIGSKQREARWKKKWPSYEYKGKWGREPLDEASLTYVNEALKHPIWKELYDARVQLLPGGMGCTISINAKISYEYILFYLTIARYIEEYPQRVTWWYEAYQQGIDPLQALMLMEDYRRAGLDGHSLGGGGDGIKLPFKDWPRAVCAEIQDNVKMKNNRNMHDAFRALNVGNWPRMERHQLALKKLGIIGLKPSEWSDAQVKAIKAELAHPNLETCTQQEYKKYVKPEPAWKRQYANIRG